MNTRESIIQLGDALIREKGYNAFSFSDISRELNIKNASVHYHFPTKTHLGLAVIEQHTIKLEELKAKTSGKDPLQQLQAFLGIYTAIKAENKVCIVGSLATDLQTVETEIQEALKKLAGNIIGWITGILEEGKAKGVFHFSSVARVKALLIITNMLAAVQLTRLTGRNDFTQIKQTIITELTQQV